MTLTDGSTAPAVAPGLRLERGNDGQLWAHCEGESRAVQVRRLFPWSQPGCYVSLRDREEEEVYLLRDLDELDPVSRAAMVEALVEAGFVMEITRIHSCVEEIEIRVFVVDTKQGRRTFETARDEWPQQLVGGGLLIKDVAGDLYRVDAPGELDVQSQKLLWVFLD